jgi:hypothetical protein
MAVIMPDGNVGGCCAVEAPVNRIYIEYVQPVYHAIKLSSDMRYGTEKLSAIFGTDYFAAKDIRWRVAKIVSRPMIALRH